MALWHAGLFVTSFLCGASIAGALPSVVVEGQGSPLRHLLMEDGHLNDTNTTDIAGKEQEEH